MLVFRYNYGLYSNDYDDATFASGAIRYGYSNSLTLSGGAEASTDGCRISAQDLPRIFLVLGDQCRHCSEPV